MRCQNCSAVQQTPRVKRFDTKNLFRGHPVRAGAGLLAPDFLAVELEDVVGFRAQQRDLLLAEAIEKKT
jgi:hypothetical protein